MNLPLSKIQEQFWVLGNLYPNTSTYNIPLVYKLSGRLRIDSFREAIASVFQMHTFLSATINITDHGPSFEIPSVLDINNYFEVQNVYDKSSNEDINAHILNEVHSTFKLNGDFLTRIRYISFSESAYLVFVFHHIIIDHRSKEIILSDISRNYSSIVKKISDDTYNTANGYESYIEYEKNWLTSARAHKMRDEWKSFLRDNIHQLNLPFDRNSEMTFKAQGKRIHFSLPKEVSNQIDNFATENNITSFVFLLSAYAIFLARIGEQNKFVIGVPLSNRRNEDFLNTVGCFVNILPLEINLDQKKIFVEIVKQVRIELLKNHRRQEIPFIELQALYNENQKGYPFHVGFTFEGPVDFSLENTVLEPQIIEREGSQLELFLTLWSSNKGYQGFWEFNTDKFTDETVNGFIDIFKKIIQEVLVSPNKQYLDYHILSESDKRLIETVNSTKCPYHDTVCIHQIFEKKAIEIPHNLALLYNNIELSYNELNIYSNQLANYLIENTAQIGDIIAIACERRVEMIISIFAVLKTGAAYLPIHINNPIEVTQEIIDTAKPKFILASSLGSHNVDSKNPIVSIEKILQNPYSSNNLNPDINVSSNDLAYIIFTSGSTGVPKGVAIKHHSVINRLEWMQKSYPLSENDVLLQKTPITFDVSVWELFWWFFGGAKLSLLKQDGEKDPMLIIRTIKMQNITKIHFVPSMFVFFIDALRNQSLTDQIRSLKTIFCSGESLPSSMIKAFNSLESSFPLAKVVNLYGPTEATVDVSYYNCPEKISDKDKIFIGRPIHNTELYVVNENLIVQPVGLKGELLITGANLAVGYLNNKELTRKKFVNFNKPNGEQVIAYRTGDIAALNDNGEIEYIGRKDSQVKIRGIRIELGEIEAKLTKHPKVSAAAVSLINEQENKSIISYVVLLEQNSISERELLNDLKEILSPVMMPSQIIFLDNMPLSSSGKIDRNRLPEPKQRIRSDKRITKPESFNENKLFCLWSKILETNNIQITDNFYDIGGNSLLAIKLSMLIATTFSIEPDVISILEYPTIKDYASYLDNKIMFKQNRSNNVKEKYVDRSELMRSRNR